MDHMSKGNLSQLEANTEIPRLTKLVEPGCSMMEKTTCGGCSCTTPLDDTAHATSMMVLKAHTAFASPQERMLLCEAFPTMVFVFVDEVNMSDCVQQSNATGLHCSPESALNEKLLTLLSISWKASWTNL